MSFLLQDSLSIQKPSWAVETKIQIPVGSTKDNSVFTFISTCSIVLRLAVQLNKLFTLDELDVDFRDMQEEQLQIFRVLEGALQSAGMDGKACLLRTICELQRRPIGKYSIIGEIVTLLLTPKTGESNFLEEHLEAQRWGQSLKENQSCAAKFRGCPMSLFNLFRSLDNEKPQRQQQQTSQESNCENRVKDGEIRTPIFSTVAKDDAEAENEIPDFL